jgi:hypothetical protein
MPRSTADLIAQLSASEFNVSFVAGSATSEPAGGELASVAAEGSGVILVAVLDPRTTVCWTGALDPGARTPQGLAPGENLGYYVLDRRASSPDRICSAATAATRAEWKQTTSWRYWRSQGSPTVTRER